MKNRGYGWSAALLGCSLVYILLSAVSIVYTIVYKQPFISERIDRLISQSTTVACFELALSIAGMSVPRWSNRNTQALFVLGLIVCLIFILGQGAVRVEAPASNIYDGIYSGLCAANFICLIGYSFSFRISEKESAGGQQGAAAKP
ncbi:MAG TPA: hypothetical protein PK438_00595 [Clostridia bacterium]|nr:hypothetical protein [Clostridia bacterium]